MPIRVHGLEQLSKKLDRYSKGITPMLERTTKEAILYVHGEMPSYPSGPWHRTMTLWRTITSLSGSYPEALSRVERLFSMVRGIVGTALSYAPWVIDQDRQVWFHKKHGWWTLQGVVKNARKGIVAIYEGAVRDFTRRTF